MNRQLSVIPWNAATASYGSGMGQTLAAWGIADEVPFAFHSGAPDELTLTFPGQAKVDNAWFGYRSVVTLALDTGIFFTGYIPDDQGRDFDGSKNATTVKVLGPWWFLENLEYKIVIPMTSGYTPGKNPQPIVVPFSYSHFTLNLNVVATTSNNGLVYSWLPLSSQDEIKRILDFAINAGANFQYVYADILNIPVLPRDVLNISCADAIRRQMEDVDAVAWFDHTIYPPMFRIKQRKDLPGIVHQLAAPASGAALGGTVKVRGVEKLHQRWDLAVPSVRIDFEQSNSVNGQTVLNVVSDIYPQPLPVDQLKALTVTVPIRGFSTNTTQQWIKTLAFDPNSLAFWHLRKPETDPTVNTNAAVEYYGLSIVPNSAQRQGTLPNMIIEGGYADWMGGNFFEDNISATANYERRISGVLTGTQIPQHTFRTRVATTDLDYPNGQYLIATSISQLGENPGSFVGLAQITWTDLNAPQWEGGLSLFEGSFSQTIVMGLNYSVLNGRTEWATMKALAQQVSGVCREAGLYYSVQLGPNKKLSPGQFADRLRAKRLAYITPTLCGPYANGSSAQLAKNMKQDNVSESEPLRTQDHVSDGLGGVLLQTANGSPALAVQLYDGHGVARTPATGGGRVLINQSATTGSDGAPHDVMLREMKIPVVYKGVCYQRSVLVLCSDVYQGAGDPPYAN